MKKILKILPLLILICLSFTFLTAQTVAAKTEEAVTLTLKNTADGIRLSWNGDKNTAYSVFKKNDAGRYIKLTSVKGKKYTDKDVESGKKYSYCVRKTKTVKSDKVSLTYLDAPRIKEALFTDTGITLVWEGVKGADKYAVYRKTDGGKRIKLGSAKGLTFTDTAAEQDVKYYYTVKAYKKGSLSASEKAFTAINLSIPEISSVKRQNGNLKISWKKTEGAEKYIIYRTPFSENKWEKIAEISSSKSYFKDKTVESDKKYSYYVTAVSGNYESQFGDRYLSRTYISPPASFSLRQSAKKVTLTWKKVDGAIRYELYRKTADGKWTKYKELKPNKEKYTQTLSSLTEKVSYKIRTVTEKGNSAFTSVRTSRYVDPDKPMVALTYDDGPHPTHTHTILDVLEKYNARATFFVVGERITPYSDCLVRQNELGCEIANHTYSHISLSSSKDKTITQQVNKTDKLIKKYSGQTCSLIRAPGGSVGKGSRLIDKPFIHWSVDTRDWECLSSSTVVSHIKRNIRDGSIVLMHDLYGSTANATKEIVPWLIDKGYQLVTVSEMMEAKGIRLESGKKYYNGYT